MTAAIEQVGLIGLGKMGLPMARHMCAKGFAVSAYDTDAACCARAAAIGAKVCSDAAEVARNSDLVIVIVGFDSEVLQVLNGPHGVLAGARDGAILAIASTVYPETMTEIAAEATKRVPSLSVIDIPLCRSDRAAEDGTLLVLGGGPRVAFDRVRPVFESFATDICLLGELGAGQIAKMINNLLLWACVSADHEGLKLGEAMGLDPETLREALLKSSGRNWALETWHLPRTMPWAEKDMGIVLHEAARFGLDLPLSRMVEDVIRDIKRARGLIPPADRKREA